MAAKPVIKPITKPIKVLFVCLGNICRSPTAHGVFAQLVVDSNLTDAIEVDSAGTAAWHVGKSPDVRTTAAAARRGYDLSSLQARQASANDFLEFDYILAMDEENLSELQRLKPADYAGQLALFMDYHPHDHRAVPDPYYGGEEGFEKVLDLVEVASQHLLQHLQQQWVERRLPR